MKKIKVDQSMCIGCGACASIDDEDLTINSEGVSEPITGTVKNEAKAEDAKESCPVGAITIEDDDEK